MTNHANYRALSPEPTKARQEYTYAERRAELYDMIERAGHYRNLERSTRELGDRYGVSHTTIRKDIQSILDWKAEHLGENTTAELETLKTKAVQDALDNGNADRAYEIMSSHLQNLQSLGVIDEAPDKQAVEHATADGEGFSFEINFSEDTDDGDDA